MSFSIVYFPSLLSAQTTENKRGTHILLICTHNMESTFSNMGPRRYFSLMKSTDIYWAPITEKCKYSKTVTHWAEDGKVKGRMVLILSSPINTCRRKLQLYVAENSFSWVESAWKERGKGGRRLAESFQRAQAVLTWHDRLLIFLLGSGLLSINVTDKN